MRLTPEYNDPCFDTSGKIEFFKELVPQLNEDGEKTGIVSEIEYCYEFGDKKVIIVVYFDSSILDQEQIDIHFHDKRVHYGL